MFRLYCSFSFLVSHKRCTKHGNQTYNQSFHVGLCNRQNYASPLFKITCTYWHNPVYLLHAIWSYNERWDFPRAGSSLFLPRFSGLTFLRFLGPFFIFSEIFASGVLYFLRWFFIFFQLLNEMKGTYMNNKKNLAALDLYVFFDSNTF